MRALEIAQRRYEVLAHRTRNRGEDYVGEAERFKVVCDALFDGRLKLSSNALVIGDPSVNAQRVDPIIKPPKLDAGDFEL